MCFQTRNSCAKAFNNRSRSKKLKPKKSRRGGGGQFDPNPFKASRVKNVNFFKIAHFCCPKSQTFSMIIYPEHAEKVSVHSTSGSIQSASAPCFYFFSF